MNYPCKGCQDRQIGCHANCQKYQAAQEEAKKAKAEKMKEHAIGDMEVERSKRISKRRHKKT